MTAAFWNGLATMASPRAIRADWEWYFGSALGLVSPFLTATSDLSRSYPCRARPECGCRHEVRETEAGLLAVCRCGGGECPAPEIEPGQLVIERLNLQRLGAAVRSAAGFGAPGAGAYVSATTVEVGCWEPQRAPVYLVVAGAPVLAEELERLTRRRPGPFVLLTPASLPGAGLDAALRLAGGVHVVLADFLEPGDGGVFRLTQPPGRLLAARPGRVAEADGVLSGLRREVATMRRELAWRPAAPEPAAASVAHQVFNVLKELEESGRGRKAPMAQVFRLYCLEGLSAAAVARRCGCAKSLVVLRLRELRAKLGRDPAELRACTGQFEELESALADPRARRINRKRAIYGSGVDEE